METASENSIINSKADKSELSAIALEAAFLTLKSRRIIPLETVRGNYKIADKPVFKLEDGSLGFCISRKFNSIEDIEKELSDSSKTHYVFEVCEFDVYGINLEKTGKITYTLRACVKEA